MDNVTIVVRVYVMLVLLMWIVLLIYPKRRHLLAQVYKQIHLIFQQKEILMILLYHLLVS